MSLPIPLRPTAAALAALVLLAACGTGGEAPADGGDVDTYEVRGVVVSVPDPADELSNLAIRHEAIDDFRSIEGEVVGMDAMTMPFPVAEGVDLAPIAPGDEVEFTLEVEWEGEPPYRVTRIEELAPGAAELEFRKASPPGE